MENLRTYPTGYVNECFTKLHNKNIPIVEHKDMMLPLYMSHCKIPNGSNYFLFLSADKIKNRLDDII